MFPKALNRSPRVTRLLRRIAIAAIVAEVGGAIALAQEEKQAAFLPPPEQAVEAVMGAESSSPDLPAVDPNALVERDRPRRERVVPEKPAWTVLSDTDQPRVIVMKFREGTRIRQRAGELVAELGQSAVADSKLLQRANLDANRVALELANVKQLVELDPRFNVSRLFSRLEEDLDQDRREGEEKSDEELADLNLYFRISVETTQREDTEALINELNTWDIVEIAYAEPIPANAAADIAPITANFTTRQTYRGPAPIGVDAEYGRALLTGSRVRLIDIEANWELNHEDLPSVFYQSGVLTGNQDHGTAVLGVIAAANNSYGMTGIVPLCSVGVSAVTRRHSCYWGLSTCDEYDFAEAFNAAAAQLQAGDVILIEQHNPGPDSGLTCPCNCPQFEYLPMEYWQANYDAIRSATSRGIYVVEAAGNGSMELDAPRYGGRLTYAVRDSRAIMVGAGVPSSRSPECFTNHGTRVDVQGWGSGVATLSYGDLARVNGTDDRQWYTRSFSGTSSASAIVAGVVAQISDCRERMGLTALGPTAMRELLIDTGTAAPAGPKHIGPLPNLREALDANGYGSWIAPESISPSTTWQTDRGWLALGGFKEYRFQAMSAGDYFSFDARGPGTSTPLNCSIEIRNSARTYSANFEGGQFAWRAPSSGFFVLRINYRGSVTNDFAFKHRRGCGSPLPAPIVVNTNDACSSVQVSWSSVLGATSYQVLRSSSATGTFSALGSPTTDTHYSDSSAAENTAYYYKVRAIDACVQNGSLSAPVLGKRNVPPPAPTITVTGLCNGIRISWTAVAGASEGYVIERSDNQTSGFVRVGTSRDFTSFFDGDVAASRTYWYRVRARSTCREGTNSAARSGQVSSTLPAPGTPNASDGTDCTVVHITWPAVTGAASYDVQRSTSASGPYTSVRNGILGLSFDDTPPTRGTIYYYKVRVQGACSNWSPLSGYNSGYRRSSPCP